MQNRKKAGNVHNPFARRGGPAARAHPPAEPAANGTSAGEGLEMVALSGTPREIGETWGRANASNIRRDMERCFLVPAREHGVSEAVLLDRGNRFIELCRELAPHWLEEIRAVARAAGVNEDLYAVFAGSVYRSLFLGGECTSYSVSPEATAGRRIFFHKTRDNISRPQSAFILASSLPGVNKFIAVSDSSVIACMMMLNDKGLAGSADTGGLTVKTPRFRGMMNAHILRHVAERASNCDEALAMVREYVEEGWYAGGAKTGTHWHFVDAAGKRLEISCSSTEITQAYHSGKVYFSARRDSRAAEYLREAAAPLDFATFRNVSRDPSVCFPSSIAGMTAEISREHPALLSYAWVSMPAGGPGFPLYVGGTKTPLPLLNGEADALFRRLINPAKRWEDLEALHFADQRKLGREIEKRIPFDPPSELSRELDAWTQRCAAENMAVE